MTEYDNPIKFFNAWLTEVKTLLPEERKEEAIEMVLSTATSDALPAARYVHLKYVKGGKFYFFSNYNSRKGTHLAENPHAALLFYWKSLNRCVRIEGTVERASAEESDAYWEQRLRGSQISALSSDQSRVMPDEHEYAKRVQENTEKFEGERIPRPSFWGGYCLSPHRIEFWEGGEYRRHSRLEYILDADHGTWNKQRLFP